MIVKHARCLDSKQFDFNNAMESMKLLLKRLTFLKAIPSTTTDKARLSFKAVEGQSKWNSKLLGQASEKCMTSFFKELTGDSLRKKLCIILPLIFTWVKRGFSPNKNFAPKNMEELTTQSRFLIMLDRSMRTTYKKTERRSSNMQMINRNVL